VCEREREREREEGEREREREQDSERASEKKERGKASVGIPPHMRERYEEFQHHLSASGV
jgi:hypothetical protein